MKEQMNCFVFGMGSWCWVVVGGGLWFKLFGQIVSPSAQKQNKTGDNRPGLWALHLSKKLLSSNASPCWFPSLDLVTTDLEKADFRNATEGLIVIECVY